MPHHYNCGCLCSNYSDAESLLAFAHNLVPPNHPKRFCGTDSAQLPARFGNGRFRANPPFRWVPSWFSPDRCTCSAAGRPWCPRPSVSSAAPAGSSGPSPFSRAASPSCSLPSSTVRPEKGRSRDRETLHQLRNGRQQILTTSRQTEPAEGRYECW